MVRVARGALVIFLEAALTLLAPAFLTIGLAISLLLNVFFGWVVFLVARAIVTKKIKYIIHSLMLHKN